MFRLLRHLLAAAAAAAMVLAPSGRALAQQNNGTIAGRVVEIHVQDGQSVEYGQLLMTIDTAGGTKKA